MSGVPDVKAQRPEADERAVPGAMKAKQARAGTMGRSSVSDPLAGGHRAAWPTSSLVISDRLSWVKNEKGNFRALMGRSAKIAWYLPVCDVCNQVSVIRTHFGFSELLV